MQKTRRLASLATALVIGAAAVTGCGSDDDSSSTAAAGAGGADASAVDVAAATKFLAPYTGKSSPFTVTEPLKEKPKAGTKVIFLNPGTAIGSLMYSLLEPAAKEMGVELSQVKAGPSAQATSAALDSVVEQKPDGVIDIGLEPVLFANQLKQLKDQGTVFVASGISGGDKYGLGTVPYGPADSELVGQLMAAWAVKQSKGDLKEAVFYSIPELGFSKPTLAGAKAKLAELCAACKLREVDIPASAIGTSAPQTIVSDLQANPKTQAAIYSADDLQVGLPAAMKTAGLDVPGIGAGPSPTTLQQIKSGQQAAGTGTDLPVIVWTLMDQFARTLADQELGAEQAKGITNHQVLEKADITFDPKNGWTGYPDFVQRFKKLWDAGAAESR